MFHGTLLYLVVTKFLYWLCWVPLNLESSFAKRCLHHLFVMNHQKYPLFIVPSMNVLSKCYTYILNSNNNIHNWICFCNDKGFKMGFNSLFWKNWKHNTLQIYITFFSLFYSIVGYMFPCCVAMSPSIIVLSGTWYFAFVESRFWYLSFSWNM